MKYHEVEIYQKRSQYLRNEPKLYKMPRISEQHGQSMRFP